MVDGAKVRLDRWLWAARFYKTRSLAVSAIRGGKITVNGLIGRPARRIDVGTMLNIRKAQLVYEITVTELSDKRLGARLARELYKESPTSVNAREERIRQIKANKQTLIDGRPSKKDRRIRHAIKRLER